MKHTGVTAKDVADAAWKLHLSHKLTARALAKRFGVNESRLCTEFRRLRKQQETAIDAGRSSTAD